MLHFIIICTQFHDVLSDGQINYICTQVRKTSLLFVRRSVLLLPSSHAIYWGLSTTAKCLHTSCHVCDTPTKCQYIVAVLCPVVKCLYSWASKTADTSGKSFSTKLNHVLFALKMSRENILKTQKHVVSLPVLCCAVLITLFTPGKVNSLSFTPNLRASLYLK